MNENANTEKKNPRGWGLTKHRGPRFGIDKPAVAGPGRPPLPEGEKERRKYLRNMIQEATPRAIEVLKESLQCEQDKDRIRAAEVIVSHSIPKQEEVETSGSTNHFINVEPKQLPGLLESIDREIVARKISDEGGVGPTA
jgi:hypothetical protein